MIAALPMYDRPETAAAHDALWSLVREAHGNGLPGHLTRDMAPAETWAHPALVLGQICGLPFSTTFRGRLSYVGTGTYEIDAPPGHYRSVWVARQDDDRDELNRFGGATFAYNEEGSQSGYAGPLADAASAGIRFGGWLQTGTHASSAAAVAAGRADIAGIDAVTWRMIARHDPFAARLRVVGTTPQAPGLAFVTARGRDASRMRAALATAIRELRQPHRSALGLHGLEDLPLGAYDALPRPPEI